MKKIALFPGQGSQYVGMGSKISQEFAPAAELLGQADEILGFKLSKMLFEGPEEELKLTQNTQPALFICSAMVDLFLKSTGKTYDFVAGHSLGEYSAIYSAGGMDFESALKIVRLRGESMAAAGKKSPGAMAAVLGMEDEEVLAEIEKFTSRGVIVIANYNCPGQVVVSGEVEVVNQFSEHISARGKKVVLLPVSGAFHSPLMDFAVEGLTEAVNQTKFNSLSTPLIANISAEIVTEAEDLKNGLISQLTGSVRWTQSMQKAIELGVEQGYEIGAGKVLFGLMRKISRNVKVTPVQSAADIA